MKHMKLKDLEKALIPKPLTEEEKEVHNNIGEWDYFYIDEENKKAWTEDEDGNFLLELHFEHTKKLLEKRTFFDILHSNLSVTKYEIRTVNKKIKRDEENPLPQEEIDSILQCLYDVGKTKALGNLSRYVMTKLCGITVDEMISYAQENQLQYMIYENKHKLSLGTIYLYDEKELIDILSKEKESLQEANVPYDDCKNFIRHIHKNVICSEEYPNAYRAIGKTFNDERFRE